MPNDYDTYNEVTFEIYTMASIRHAVIREKKRKALQAKREISLSSLPETVFMELFTVLPIEKLEAATITFPVLDMQVSVHNHRLGQALSYLPRSKRDVLLLSFYLKMSDSEIAKRLGVSKSTAQRRRQAGLEQLRTFMESEL